MTPDNQERADRVAAAVCAYFDAYETPDENWDTVLADLFADLMHYAESVYSNPNAIIGRATMHYRAESDDTQ